MAGFEAGFFEVETDTLGILSRRIVSVNLGAKSVI